MWDGDEIAWIATSMKLRNLHGWGLDTKRGEHADALGQSLLRLVGAKSALNLVSILAVLLVHVCAGTVQVPFHSIGVELLPFEQYQEEHTGMPCLANGWRSFAA